jgi:hypothetical protein
LKSWGDGKDVKKIISYLEGDSLLKDIAHSFDNNDNDDEIVMIDGTNCL